MKRIKRRAAAALVLAGLLVIGLGIFLCRLYVHGGDWASYRANAHVFNSNGALVSGAITDRNGSALPARRRSARRWRPRSGPVSVP